MSGSPSTNKVIRPSSLVEWLDCPRRWATRHQYNLLLTYGYELNAPRPSHVGAAVGGAVHVAAGWTLTQKRDTGGLGNATEAEDRAVEELRNRMDEGVSWDETTENLGVAQKQVARMTRMYRAEIAPKVQPLVVETRFEWEMAEGWVLSGQMDALGGDPDEHIEDLKTGTRRRANAVQYGAYYIILAGHGYRPRAIYEDFLPRVKLAKEQPLPQRHEFPIDHAVSDALETIEDIQRAVRRFDERARGDDDSNRAPPTAFRANPNSALCAAKWCRAHGTEFCKAHSQEK